MLSNANCRTAYTFSVGSIGMGLTQRTDLNGNMVVCIENIEDGSQSANFKTLQVGHIIEKIGVNSVIGLDLDAVIETVKNTERPCKYVFRNPKQSLQPKRLGSSNANNNDVAIEIRQEKEAISQPTQASLVKASQEKDKKRKKSKFKPIFRRCGWGEVSVEYSEKALHLWREMVQEQKNLIEEAGLEICETPKEDPIPFSMRLALSLFLFLFVLMGAASSMTSVERIIGMLFLALFLCVSGFFCAPVLQKIWQIVNKPRKLGFEINEDMPLRILFQGPFLLLESFRKNFPTVSDVIEPSFADNTFLFADNTFLSNEDMDIISARAYADEMSKWCIIGLDPRPTLEFSENGWELTRKEFQFVLHQFSVGDTFSLKLKASDSKGVDLRERSFQLTVVAEERDQPDFPGLKFGKVQKGPHVVSHNRFLCCSFNNRIVGKFLYLVFILSPLGLVAMMVIAVIASGDGGGGDDDDDNDCCCCCSDFIDDCRSFIFDYSLEKMLQKVEYSLDYDEGDDEDESEGDDEDESDDEDVKELNYKIDGYMLDVFENSLEVTGSFKRSRSKNNESEKKAKRESESDNDDDVDDDDGDVDDDDESAPSILSTINISLTCGK